MEQPKMRKENKWISHVKKFAAENGINYAVALKDPRTKASYREEPEILNEKVKYRRDRERVMRPIMRPVESTYVFRDLTKQKLEMKKAIAAEDKANARKKRNMMRDAELERVKSELSGMPPQMIPPETAKELALKIKNVMLTAKKDKESAKMKLKNK